MGKEKQGDGKMTDKEIQASDEEMEQFNVLQNEKCVSVKTEKLNDLKNRISFALKDATLQQGFEIICKRIEELEKENKKLQDFLSVGSTLNKGLNSMNKALEEERDKYRNMVFEKDAQLIKAKEIIKEMLSILPKENIEGVYEITEHAEQFLN